MFAIDDRTGNVGVVETGAGLSSWWTLGDGAQP
jgi:hypothetical protein